MTLDHLGAKMRCVVINAVSGPLLTKSRAVIEFLG
jgi:hypothetical protein